MKLSKEEEQLYQRHFSLNEIGKKGQLKLKGAKILVVGAGGLGCPVIQYLVSAGVGNIGIIDDDRVSFSNLQRQFLFNVNDVGKFKIDVIKSKMELHNPYVTIKTIHNKFNQNNGLELVRDYDLVIDATDNFETKYLINDACFYSDKTLVSASIDGFKGQLAVFNAFPYKETVNYRDIFPNIPAEGECNTCAENGVIGALPGILGTMQVNEAIKIILNIGKPLKNKILFIDLLEMQFQKYNIEIDPDNILRANKSDRIELKTEIKEFLSQEEAFLISYQELKEIDLSRENILLVDVRNSSEFEKFNIGGINIPLDELKNEQYHFQEFKKVIFYCQTGMRSYQAVQEIRNNLPNLTNKILSLRDGIKNLQ
ncbi:hypothetical protein CF386_12580 [Paraphotobacterium marinum]|uniref:Molybdopterin-synthase adenylyltransferase n=1 Tax=Paraphotobacterium marinum TaxID=1755811 RepID=A0A220VHM2_9GAMM|nr:HesA/MoeB/ThiF family protein [Paraphotobacterium marinum]ASK79865.1 hypothetical protein CF386_12580 [Paraphotobacterium marinum]